MTALSSKLKNLRTYFGKTIWQPVQLEDRSPQGRLSAFLRVVSITLTGINENGIFSRAASLSYTSLLGLGPLIAIAVFFAGLVLDNENPNLAVDALNRVLRFIAPQVIQYEEMSATDPNRDTVQELEENVEVNPRLVGLINQFVSGSRSGTVGVLGALTLIVIVIQMFTSVENAFNDIWGVRQGRSWFLRIVLYWTVVTLGAVLVFAGLAMLAAGTLTNLLGILPLGPKLLSLLQLFTPAISFLLLTGLLALFYRFIPNTHVYWKAALIGGLVVVILLFLNNLLAFLYFRRVILSQSLYGSLGILPILMLGLYIFWLFLLVGGQITYAVQNAGNRRSEIAWHDLSAADREEVSLLVLILVCRRFRECQPPFTLTEIGAILRVPTQILNESLNRLIDLRLVSPVPPRPTDTVQALRYQPARPLNRLTLARFRELFSDYGDRAGEELATYPEPLLDRYRRQLAEAVRVTLGRQSIEEMIEAEERVAALPPASTPPA